jgi:hypothetical protein
MVTATLPSHTFVSSAAGVSLPLLHVAATVHFERTGFINIGGLVGTTWRASAIQGRSLRHRADFNCYTPETDINGGVLFRAMVQQERVARWEEALRAQLALEVASRARWDEAVREGAALHAQSAYSHRPWCAQLEVYA